MLRQFYIGWKQQQIEPNQKNTISHKKNHIINGETKNAPDQQSHTSLKVQHKQHILILHRNQRKMNITFNKQAKKQTPISH